jgi:hypothetical protein
LIYSEALKAKEEMQAFISQIHSLQDENFNLKSTINQMQITIDNLQYDK